MIAFQKALDAIHVGVNPYDGFDYESKDLDVQGWGSDHPIFEEVIDANNKHRPITIIEVGSWKGGSARHMAQLLKQKSVDGVIICVDTWLAEEVLWTSDEWRSSLKLKNGRPNVYQTFMANTVNANLQGYIIPLSMPSFNAARYLKTKKITAEIIYIDGCHVEGAVYQDLVSYWHLLKPKGTMIIDDYHSMFPGLLKDVKSFARQMDLQIKDLQTKCVLTKP